MKFDYLVKHNGVYYKAGQDVPIEAKASVGSSKPSVAEGKVEKAVAVEPKEERLPSDTSTVDTKYTKTDINRMSTKELRELANANGIDGDSYVGSELKTILIEKLI